MRRATAVALAVLTLLALPAPRARAYDDDAPIQRRLVDLYLGDALEDIQRIYAPAQEWPSHVEPKNHVTRYRVERSMLKSPDKDVDVMWLGLKHNRLVELQLIYDAKYTRAESVEALAQQLSLVYGEPESDNGKYWWTDGKTMLRVFYAEVPTLKDGEKGVELRTSLQLADAWLFR